MFIFWVTGPHTGRIVTQWRYCKQSKDWRRGQTYPQPLLLCSEISLFWRTPCARDFLFVALVFLQIFDGSLSSSSSGKSSQYLSSGPGVSSIRFPRVHFKTVSSSRKLRNRSLRRRRIFDFWKSGCQEPEPEAIRSGRLYLSKILESEPKAEVYLWFLKQRMSRVGTRKWLAPGTLPPDLMSIVRGMAESKNFFFF